MIATMGQGDSLAAAMILLNYTSLVECPASKPSKSVEFGILCGD